LIDLFENSKPEPLKTLKSGFQTRVAGQHPPLSRTPERPRPPGSGDSALELFRAELAALRTRVEILERYRGVRDQADADVVRALADAFGGEPFTARRAFAANLPALLTALQEADVDDPRQLGCLLRALGPRPIGGLVVERAGVDRDGVVWRLRVRNSQPGDGTD
jgi:hypothetical protein